MTFDRPHSLSFAFLLAQKMQHKQKFCPGPNLLCVLSKATCNLPHMHPRPCVKILHPLATTNIFIAPALYYALKVLVNTQTTLVLMKSEHLNIFLTLLSCESQSCFQNWGPSSPSLSKRQPSKLSLIGQKCQVV